jgi:hypothetical protein
MFIKFCKNFLAIFCLALIFACKSDPYLYDNIGFDKGRRPESAQSQGLPARTAPDYYNRQQYPAQQQYYPPQAQQYAPQGQMPYAVPQAMPPQQYYYPQPSYAQPGYPQMVPGSRFYSNPYAVPPSNYYSYYDADQYYVPPYYQNNIEPQQNNRNAASLGSF